MACTSSSLLDYLRDFTGQNPLDAAVCPFTSSAGASMPLAVLSLFVFGFIGLALAVRVQHPGPIVVAAILTASVVAASLPGIAAKILAIVILFTLTAGAMYLYSRAQSTL